jgi:2-methylcitrate dehydratase PrpD
VKGKTDLTGIVAAYVAGEEAGRIPENVAARAKLHILDALGAMVSGTLLKPGRLIVDFVRKQGGGAEAMVVASTLRTNRVNAALANGTLAHADETDDTHFPTQTHPSAIAVPAGLAIGEQQRCSGKELIAAVVLGYDILCRVCRTFDRKWMQDRCLNPGSICGGFGAAATACRLLKLPVTQVRYALAFAATQASGLTTWRQDPEHIDKALCHSGIPARDGVTAALWAQSGMTATGDIFAGPDNFLRPFAQPSNTAELTRELGSRYEIMETGIKIYPGGQPMQATLTGYFRLVQENRLTGENIRKITVRLPESQSRTINDRHMPDINCQYLLSVAMLDGKVDFHSAHDFERMQNPQVLELKKRVEIIADPELTRKHPAIRSAIVEITTSDGRLLTTLVDRLPGAPYNPLSAQEVEEKFMSLSAPVLGEGRAKSVARTCLELENLSAIASLTALLS